jgi:hypothetical protein
MTTGTDKKEVSSPKGVDGLNGSHFRVYSGKGIEIDGRASISRVGPWSISRRDRPSFAEVGSITTVEIQSKIFGRSR